MIPTKQFGDALKELGYTFYAGVPCSFLKNLINYAINECDYVMAANEGDAVAVAAGAYLGGKKSVVLMQNSGLTNATSPLTSLNFTFQIPVLGFVSLRGEPGLKDEPQHELMGQITEQMLTLMNVKWEYLSTDFTVAQKQLAQADNFVNKGQSFFFVVRKDTLESVELKKQDLSIRKNISNRKNSNTYKLPSRKSVLIALSEIIDQKSIVLATTGKTGRELFEVDDKPNNFYMVGSMGCVSSLGLGLALTRPDKDVIVIDGDGAALMRLGAFATNAYYSPSNMFHILLDNQTHDSTGGQATVSHNINFSDHAASMSYPVVREVGTMAALLEAINVWRNEKKLTFIHMKIGKGSGKNLGRPTVSPVQVKERLMNYINQ